MEEGGAIFVTVDVRLPARGKLDCSRLSSNY